jgi:hypothetical protein
MRQLDKDENNQLTNICSLRIDAEITDVNAQIKEVRPSGARPIQHRRPPY